MEPAFDMEEFIRQKLADMKSLEQKELLRDMMEAVFLPMYRQTETHYGRLKQRVRDELTVGVNDYAIYTSVMTERELSMPHSYLRPMLREDSNAHIPALNTAEPVLDTLYCQIAYPVFLERRKRYSGFQGVIQTDKGNVDATFALRPAKRYVDAVYELYRTFQANQVPWKTPCAPLLFHFYDLIPIKIGQIPTDAVYLGYRADGLAAYSPSEDRKIPVWNIQTVSVSSKEFAEPALDKVNYEHEVELAPLPPGNYLAIPKGNVLAARKEKNTLIVVSPEEEQLVCDAYHILSYANLPTNKLEAQLFSNHNQDTFAGRMSSWYQQNIKTRGEFQRLIYSMGANHRYHLRGIEVLYEPYQGETYEVDIFIRDEIRDAAVSKTLLLTFERIEQSAYYDHDLLSYYCSAIQRVYPEYSVQGIFLDQGKWVPRESGEGVAL